uniref:hypothetical protein n=1 Tax=Ornithobacterium rhinotracheale TaxID=28251 RepID=UPI0039A5B857
MHILRAIIVTLVAFNLVYMLFHWEPTSDFLGYNIPTWVYVIVQVIFVFLVIKSVKKH